MRTPDRSCGVGRGWDKVGPINLQGEGRTVRPMWRPAAEFPRRTYARTKEGGSVQTPGIRLGFRMPAASGRVRPWRVGLRGLLVLTLAVGSLLAQSEQVLPPATEVGAPIVGVPETLGMGITETVRAIMGRQRKAPRRLGNPSPADRGDQADLKLLDDPKAPAVAQWPPAPPGEAPAGPSPGNPQTPGTSFLAVSLSPPTFPESGSIPPDSMGDVGPSQILVGVNGRIKVFDKTGVVGALDSDMDVFFDSVRDGRVTTESKKT